MCVGLDSCRWIKFRHRRKSGISGMSGNAWFASLFVSTLNKFQRNRNRKREQREIKIDMRTNGKSFFDCQRRRKKSWTQENAHNVNICPSAGYLNTNNRIDEREECAMHREPAGNETEERNRKNRSDEKERMNETRRECTKRNLIYERSKRIATTTIDVQSIDLQEIARAFNSPSPLSLVFFLLRFTK